MHELSTMCSPGETIDTPPPLKLFTFLRAVMSFFQPYTNCARVCNVLVLPFPDHSPYSPEYFYPQRDTSSSILRGRLALFVRCKSGPQGKNGELRFGASSQSVTASTELSSEE